MWVALAWYVHVDVGWLKVGIGLLLLLMVLMAVVQRVLLMLMRSVSIIRVGSLHGSIKLVPVLKIFLSLLFLFSTNPTKRHVHVLKWNFFVMIVIVPPHSLITSVTSMLSIIWYLLTNMIPIMSFLLEKIVRYWIRMVPALVLELLCTVGFLIFGSHFLHWSVLKNIIAQWFVSFCPWFLFKMLIFWIAYVC